MSNTFRKNQSSARQIFSKTFFFLVAKFSGVLGKRIESGEKIY